MTLPTLKRYSAFLGATFSYISTLFYWNATSTEFSNPQDVSGAFGAWFFLGATVSWAIYLLAYTLLAIRSKKS